MTSHGSEPGGRTSLTVRPVARDQDIAEMERFASWDRRYLDVAVADLVDQGVLTEAGDGKLLVHPRRAA